MEWPGEGWCSIGNATPLAEVHRCVCAPENTETDCIVSQGYPRCIGRSQNREIYAGTPKRRFYIRACKPQPASVVPFGRCDRQRLCANFGLTHKAPGSRFATPATLSRCEPKDGLKVIGAYPRGQSHYDMKRKGRAMPRGYSVISRPGRKSEIIVLVNIPEKVALLKFSIRVFGSVSVLRSQIISLRTNAPRLLTSSLSQRLP